MVPLDRASRWHHFAPGKTPDLLIWRLGSGFSNCLDDGFGDKLLKVEYMMQVPRLRKGPPPATPYPLSSQSLRDGV